MGQGHRRGGRLGKKSVERARADLEYAADCLTDFVRGYETERAETGALLTAEFMLLVSGFLVWRQVIDDNAHGAFRSMGTDIDERAGKAVVQHRRHGDQHLAVKISPALTRILPRSAAP